MSCGWYYVCEDCLKREIEILMGDRKFIGYCDAHYNEKCDVCKKKQGKYEIYWDDDAEKMFDEIRKVVKG